MSIGDPMGGPIGKLNSNREYVIKNVVGDQNYFYPVITNRMDYPCSFSINDGSFVENRPSASIPAQSERVVLGYYRLYINSNITLYCNPSNENTYWWWGLRKDSDNGDSFFDEVEQDTGYIHFVLIGK